MAPQRDRSNDRWFDWLTACGLSAPRIATVLGLDLRIVNAGLDRRRVAALPAPTGPPRKGGASILGPTANKIQRLRELKYSAGKIAHILALDLVDVEDLVRRLKPIRRAALARPREHAQQAALRTRRRRRRPRPPIVDLWRCPGDAELDREAAMMPAIVAEARELDDHQAVAELPAAELLATPWSGPASTQARGEDHGSAKLTRPAVDKIRRLRAEGWSTGKLARQFGVARNTICAILTGKTWRDV